MMDITYGFIRSHMKKHQRVTTLLILKPDTDYIDGFRCDDPASAKSLAADMGITLVGVGVLHEIVEQRRKVSS